MKTNFITYVTTKKIWIHYKSTEISAYIAGASVRGPDIVDASKKL